MLGAYRLDQRLNPLSIRRRDKRLAVKPLPVHWLQSRKVLSDERQINLLGAWLKEQRLGAEEAGVGCLGSFCHRIQRLPCVGQAGQQRRTQDARPKASLAESSHGA